MIMGWYTRSSRFFFVAFPRYSSTNTLSSTPFQESSMRSSLFSNCLQSSFNKLRLSKFSPPIFSNSGFKSVHSNSHFLNGGAKRFYSVGKSKDSHSRQRKSKWWIGTLVFSSYIFMTVNPEVVMQNEYLEIVPFSKRIHYICITIDNEKRGGHLFFEYKVRTVYAGKVLPANHPKTIRVQRVAENIIKSMERHLEIEKETPHLKTIRVQQVAQNIIEPMERGLETEKGTPHNLNSAEGQVKFESRHLEGLEWKVIVVDDPTINATCMASGKIIVHTGLLKHIRSDDELAFVIGHEVSHIVARHTSEQRSKMRWWTRFRPMFPKFMSPFFDGMTDLLRIPLLIRLEIEADYMAMLLMAFTGYDPRVAPKFLERLDYCDFTFPRVFCMSRVKVMREVIGLYGKTSHMRSRRT